MSSKRASLKALREARTKGLKRSEQFVPEEQEDVFKEVTEEEYRVIVNGRLKEGDFVVETEDYQPSGYAENGEEFFDLEEEVSKGSAKPKKKSAATKSTAVDLGSATQRSVASMFQANTKRSTGPSTSSSNPVSSVSQTLAPKKKTESQSGLDSILGDLTSNPLGGVRTKSKKKSRPSLEPPSTKKLKASHRSSAFGTADSHEIIAPDLEPTGPEPSSSTPGPTKRIKTAAAESEEEEEEDVVMPEPPTGEGKTEEEPAIAPEVEEVQKKRMRPADSDDDETTVVQTIDFNVAEAAAKKKKEAQTAATGVKSLSGVGAEWASNDSGVTSSPEVVTCSNLPLDQDGKLQFYFMDAEEDTFKNSGTVYLFGKVALAGGQHVSCCVIVRNIERNLFFLPRPVFFENGEETSKPVTVDDVEDEVMLRLAEKYKIRQMKAKPVRRKYAFGMEGIPAEAEYLKVKYSYADRPLLPEDRSGATFAHVFGTNTTALEHLLVKRNLKGPCWLTLSGVKPVSSSLSWCRLEAAVDDPKVCIELTPQPPPPPTLTCLSLSMKTFPNPRTNANEIAIISGLIHTGVSVDGPPHQPDALSRFSCICKLPNTPYPPDFFHTIRQGGVNKHVEVCQSERQLLNFFMAKVQKLDPDILLAHNFVGFDLDVLLHRMKHHNQTFWSKLGRLKRSIMPKLQAGAGGMSESTWAEKLVTTGRLVVDTYLCAKDLVRETTYSLKYLSEHILNRQRVEVDWDTLPSYYESCQSLLDLIRHTENDAHLALSLSWHMSVIPLTKQLTNLAGNQWSHSLTGARSERNETLLLHEFHRQKFICPDKVSAAERKQELAVAKPGPEGEEDAAPAQTNTRKRKKAAYAGGLVLEPKKGFYDKFVLLLDFNSLYPSIIQEYNICFTTVQRTQQLGLDEEGDTVDQCTAIPNLPAADCEEGVLPRVIKTLVDRRRQVKNLIKDERNPAKLSQLDIRQKALKLTANSMYGCLGFSFSRFYAKPIAALVTSQGREILQNTVDLVHDVVNKEEHLSLTVVYGDTDSIMVHTESDDLKYSLQTAELIKKVVNKKYKRLEIDVDGIFKRMLLLKKKKYAALIVEKDKDGGYTTKRELKGLDMVRRDWCPLSKDIGEFALSQMFSDDSRDNIVEQIHEKLRSLPEEYAAGRIPIEKFVITKGLTKRPDDYADKKSQPHVQVALEMMGANIPVRVGQYIPYVICKGDNPSPAARAHHPAMVEKDPALEIDFAWYLSNQVHPTIARLCDPIAETDSARLAECLGLDPAKYSQKTHYGEGGAEEDEEDTLLRALSDDTRFRHCEPLRLVCPHAHPETDLACGAVAQFTSPFRAKDGAWELSLTCGSCGTPFTSAFLINSLHLAQHSFLQRYYAGWRLCDEPSCGMRTRQVSLRGESVCVAPQCTGTMRPEISDGELHTQMEYYVFLFNVDRQLALLPPADQEKARRVVTPAVREQLMPVADFMAAEMEKSGFRWVDLKKIFSFMNVGK